MPGFRAKLDVQVRATGEFSQMGDPAGYTEQLGTVFTRPCATPRCRTWWIAAYRQPGTYPDEWVNLAERPLFRDG